jgi:nucleoside-diphosphate-sugar epimerase
MKILVTGSTGQLGRDLVPRLLRKGHRLVLLARDPAKTEKMFPDCEVLRGDVTAPGFGVGSAVKPDALYHMAADISLGASRDAQVWDVNYKGAVNAVEFCKANAVPSLFYAGTAFTGKGRNVYERSKQASEEFIEASGIPSKTIYKIGILVAREADADLEPTGAIYQFCNAIAGVLDRSGRPIGPFRIKGLPAAEFNLVHVDHVAAYMAEPAAAGKFWLTHPDPVRLSELGPWVGRALEVDLRFEPEFEMTPAEALVHRLGKPFLPYFQGDPFPSHLAGLPRVSADFVTKSFAAGIRCSRERAAARR